MDSNAVTRWLAVTVLGGIAIALVWKGETAAALTIAAMVTPGAVQMPKIGGPPASSGGTS